MLYVQEDKDSASSLQRMVVKLDQQEGTST